MASAEPSPKRLPSLEDMPPEVLLNIWKHYFRGRKVRLIYRGDDEEYLDFPDNLARIWTISSTQSHLAREAMFKHTTITLDEFDEIARLLCSDHIDLSLVTSISLNLNDDTMQASYTLMDDFFRACRNLRYLRLWYRGRLRMQQDAPFGPDIKKDLTQGNTKQAEWTKTIVDDAIFDKDEWGVLDTCAWVADIVSSKAFTGLHSPPEVRVDLEVSLKEAGRSAWDGYRLPRLTYNPQSQVLSGVIEGQPVSIPQVLTTPHDGELRGGRDCICDTRVIDKTVQQTLESILSHGQRLAVGIRKRFAVYEDHSEIASGVEDLHAEICLAVDHMFGFNLRIPQCVDILDWLQARMTPVPLILGTFAEAITLCHVLMGTPLDKFSISMLDGFWDGRGGSARFTDFRSLYRFLAPSAAMHDKHHTIVAGCFDQIYQPFKGSNIVRGETRALPW